MGRPEGTWRLGHLGPSCLGSWAACVGPLGPEVMLQGHPPPAPHSSPIWTLGLTGSHPSMAEAHHLLLVAPWAAAPWGHLVNGALCRLPP